MINPFSQVSEKIREGLLSGNFALVTAPRQTSKSTQLMKVGVEFALDNPGKTVTVIGHNSQSCRNLLETFWRFVPDGHGFRDSSFALSLKNGTRVGATTPQNSRLRGTTIDLALLDEIAFWPDLKESLRVVSSAVRADSGRILAVTTSSEYIEWLQILAQIQASETWKQTSVTRKDMGMLMDPEREAFFRRTIGDRAFELEYPGP
jgi:hypothetical protein